MADKLSRPDTGKWSKTLVKISSGIRTETPLSSYQLEFFRSKDFSVNYILSLYKG